MPDEKSFHMTPDEFRRHGHAVVDWIADYYTRIESFPVLSRVKPGQIRAALASRTACARASRSNHSGDIERADSRPVSRTGSRRISLLTFPRTLRGRQFSATCFLRAWACRGCCGRPVRHARNWRRTSWTGWSRCSGCQKISFDEQRRRRNSGYGLQRFALRLAGGARTGDNFASN